MTVEASAASLAAHAGKWVLGIDGGGTRTRAWVSRVGQDGQLHCEGRAESGSSNMRAVGPERAFDSISKATESATGACEGFAGGRIAAAVIAAAGAGSPDVVQQILDWNTQTGMAETCRVAHDGEAVLAAAFGRSAGTSLIVGTGSVAMTRTPGGKTAVVGGWGYWFGDEGSGYAIGRDALNAVSRAADGRGSPTALLADALKHFGVEHAREIPTTLGKTSDARAMIAAFSPIVSAAAEAGDASAKAIIENAAVNLAELCTTSWSDAGADRPVEIAIAGGVGCGSRPLREALARRLAPTELQSVEHPVEGCVRLAAELLLETGG
ncbi:MAG: BadF/BadG/BcrA/BcrD ATPase family protein [Planctomycetota bacterium]